MVKPYFEDVFKDNYIEFDNSDEISDESIIDLKEWLESRMSNDIQDIDDLFEEYFDEDLRKWFSKDHPQGDWKRVDSKGNVVGPCARKPGEPKPKCMSKATRAKLSKKERAAAVRAKRKADPVANRAGKGGKPVMVSSFGKGKIKKEAVDDRQYDSQISERRVSEDVNRNISRKKKGNINKDFNAWYTGSQVSQYYKPNELSEETISEYGRSTDWRPEEEKTVSQKITKESIDRGIETGMALNSYSKEYNNRRKGGKVVPFKELTGDTTTASIGAQKEDELKKKGISLRTFRAKRPIG